MQKRIKIANRVLPRYSKEEETTNMVTHIIGGCIGLIILLLCVIRSISTQNILSITGSWVYGIAMVALYVVSSIYHGLPTGNAKKVMQVIDHCTIYFLIAGTYTPILLTVFVPVYPVIGWGLLIAQWFLLVLAVTLTAIDLKKFRVFSMACYIGMGWGIIFFIPEAISVLTPDGFFWLLTGGILYTIGAIVYGIGVKVRWMHSVFHVFVVLGSLFQFISIYQYVL